MFLNTLNKTMLSKKMREDRYQKLLEQSHIRHKKMNSRTMSTSLEKRINWEKLSQHFKIMVYGKNMDGHLERVDVTIHKT